MDSGLIMVIVASLLTGLALAGVGGSVWSLRSRDPLRRRLRSAAAPGPTLDEAAGATERPAPRLVSLLARLAGTGAGDASQLKRRLIQAGLRGESAAHVFLATKVGLALVLPLGFLAVNSALAEPLRYALPIAVWLCTGGFFVPNLWLASRGRERRMAIERALPDTLDLLVTCVEAGLGLDAALLRVAQDTSLSSPLLADELNLTFLEVKAGIPRTESFRRLYERTGAEELKSLAATLAQAEMFGTSVAVALRIQASGIRTRRMYAAEERAAVVAVKMTVPLVLCILPSLLAVVMGPAIVNIYTQLFTRLGGP